MTMNWIWVRRGITLACFAVLNSILAPVWGITEPLGRVSPQVIGGFIGFGAGILLMLLEWAVGRMSGQKLLIVFVGLITGLLITHLFWVLVREFPFAQTDLKPWILTTIGVVWCYLTLSVFLSKGEQIAPLQGLFRTAGEIKASSKILDSSVLIDGRIADLVDTDFLDGKLLIPRFVLQEVQYIADSQDPLRRQRGRRGLEVLHRVQQKMGPKAEIVETNFPHIREVDEKLVELGKVMNAKVVTNDYNLNKVAKIQGVEILNINDLSNAVKPVVLPGEAMHIKVLKEGKEQGQGVGYLDDGTMIVVENGRSSIGQSVDVVVTSVLQTAAGRMIFTKRQSNHG